MLCLYSLQVATLSVVVSVLPSSQLPVQGWFGITPYSVVTLSSLVVFLCVPGTALTNFVFARYGLVSSMFALTPTEIHSHVSGTA